MNITKQANSNILYDVSLTTTPTLKLFDRAYHANTVNQQKNSARASTASSPVPSKAGIGRAQVVYFEQQNIKMVLKHYYRGGLLASVLKDKYLGFDIENSRAFKEWRLLKKMQQLRLPVPEAIAAHIEKHLFFYRADLITREIENADTLADILIKQAINVDIWKKIGACIKVFHQHDVYHSDLNARNIMLAGGLSEADNVYLIDFDKSYFRTGVETWAKPWKLMNLARLKRSLLKFKKKQDVFNFVDNNWSALLAGYNMEVVAKG